jgi:catechol 2,3-dioxygenase-like lactoylglutathione lyase family enzyme
VPALHHVALGARNVASVAGFYRDLFGLEEIRRQGGIGEGLRSIWLGLGDAILMIEHTDEPSRAVDGVGAGPFLIALRVSPSERRTLEADLGRHGHPVESRTPHTSYFRDPEGNRVAISHYPEEP